jgi:hypothetical protein
MTERRQQRPEAGVVEAGRSALGLRVGRGPEESPGHRRGGEHATHHPHREGDDHR